jgi:hypothetical protein
LHWDTLCGVPLNEALKKFWRPYADPHQLMQLPYRQRVGSTVLLRQACAGPKNPLRK